MNRGVRPIIISTGIRLSTNVKIFKMRQKQNLKIGVGFTMLEITGTVMLLWYGFFYKNRQVKKQ